MQTILTAISNHLQKQADHIAYTFLKADSERQTRTYQQLDHRARQIAKGLLQYARPGDRALMAYPAGLDFIEAFLGCLYAGIIAVPVYPPKKNRNSDRVLAIANHCKPRLLLCSGETRSNVDGDFAATVSGSRVIATDELEDSHNHPLPLWSADHLAFLQYTSGSTAAPKGVMVSHGNIVANERLIQKSFGFSAQSIAVSWLPMFHDMGLIGGILAPLFAGFPSVLMAPNVFLREPVKWLQAVTEFRATTTGAPNFAYDVCVKKISKEQKASLDLSTLQVAYNGAEPVRAETLRSFARAFRECGFNASAFFPCYGMAETTLIVSGGPPLAETHILRLDSEALEDHRILEKHNDLVGRQCVSCGQITPEMQIRIVHPETCQESPADEVGEIWIHSNSVAQGYFNQPDETIQTFQARLDGDDRNWLRTGDYGFVIKNELFVTGRLKDLIIVRGRNIYPQDIEQLAQQHLQFVEPNAAAAFSLETDETVRLVLVAEGTREMVRWSKNNSTYDAGLAELNLSINAFRQALAEQLEVVLDDIIFVRPTAFPRTSSGKVQRRLTKQWLQEGRLETVLDYAPPTRSGSTERANKAISRLSAAVSFIESGIGEPNETLTTSAVNLDELSQEPNAIRSVEPTHCLHSGHSSQLEQSCFGSLSIRQKLKSVVIDWLKSEVNAETSEIGDDHPFGAMGVDSVSVVSLTTAFEKAFRTKLPDGILFQHRSINQLVSYLESQDLWNVDCEVRFVESRKEKEAVFRFRYSIYVDEMKRPQRYADHERRWITDPLDEYADILAVWQGDDVVGTVRMNPLRRNPLDEYRRLYGIENLSRHDLVGTSISTRIMLAAHVRRSPVSGKLLVAAFNHGRKLGIKYDYCDCNDPVLGFFERIGYRFIRRVQHPEYGDVSVMQLDLEDIAYLKSIRSPLVSE